MIKKPISPEIRQQLILAQREEITEYHIYSKLAGQTPNGENKEVLNRIAADEMRHYKLWSAYTNKEVSPSYWEVIGKIQIVHELNSICTKFLNVV